MRIYRPTWCEPCPGTMSKPCTASAGRAWRTVNCFDRAAGRVDAFITMDSNLEFQQRLVAVVLRGCRDPRSVESASGFAAPRRARDGRARGRAPWHRSARWCLTLPGALALHSVTRQFGVLQRRGDIRRGAPGPLPRQPTFLVDGGAPCTTSILATSTHATATTTDDLTWAAVDIPPERAGARTGHADPRDIAIRHVDLPRGPRREPVRGRDRDYEINGNQSRVLATVGAFRVVSSRDLETSFGRAGNPRSADLRHLRESGLVQTAPLRVTGTVSSR